MADEVTNSINKLFAEAIKDKCKDKMQIWKNDLTILIQEVNSQYIQLKQYQQIKSSQIREIKKEQAKNFIEVFGGEIKKIFTRNYNLKEAYKNKQTNNNKTYKYEFEEMIKKALSDDIMKEIEEKAYLESNIVKEYEVNSAKNELKDRENKLKVAILKLYNYLKDTIVKEITKEPIKYHIIVGAEGIDSDVVYEGDIPFDELENFLRIEGRANDYSLRLNLTLKDIEKLEQKGYLKEITGENKKIYDIVKENFDFNRGNKGNFGEAYRRALIQDKRLIDAIKNSNQNEIKKIVNDILTTTLKNTSNFMTPDVENKTTGEGEEDKALFGSAATLLSVEAVLNQAYQFLVLLDLEVKQEKYSNEKTIKEKAKQLKEITVKKAKQLSIEKIKNISIDK